MASYVKNEDETNDYYRIFYDNLHYCHQRRMELQNDLERKLRNQRLSRAAQLQGRWLEITEQERRAQLHNRRLRQDLQKAEETLNDLVARTEAMNTIRVQYEKYLEENFTQWQQKLRDRILETSERQRSCAEHVKEENGRMLNEKNYPFCSNSLNPKTVNSNQNPKPRQKGPDAKRPEQTNSHLQRPVTWLTGSLASETPPANVPKDFKNFQNCQALNQHIPLTPPCSSLHQSCSAPPSDHQRTTNLFTHAAAVWPRPVPRVMRVDRDPVEDGTQRVMPERRRGTEASAADGDGSQSSSLSHNKSSQSDNSKSHKKTPGKTQKKGLINLENILNVTPQVEDEQEEHRSKEITTVSVRTEDLKDGDMDDDDDDDDEEEDDDSDLIIVGGRRREDEKIKDDAGAEEHVRMDDEERHKIIKRKDDFEINLEGETEEENVPEKTSVSESVQNDDETDAEEVEKKVKKKSRDHVNVYKSLDGFCSDDQPEEEDVNSQNTKDEEESEDHDVVVVEKAKNCSDESDHVNCNEEEDEDEEEEGEEEEDDDIEALLKPVDFQTQQEEDVEESDQSKDLHSEPEKGKRNFTQKSNPAPTAKPTESDDESDNFYD